MNAQFLCGKTRTDSMAPKVEKDGPMFQGLYRIWIGMMNCNLLLVLHLPQQYFPTIPAAPELGQSRKVDISRLREIKKRMDTGHISLSELEVIAMECLDELVELCSGKLTLCWPEQGLIQH